MTAPRLARNETFHALSARLKPRYFRLFRFDEIALMPWWRKAISISLWVVKLLSGIVVAVDMVALSWKLIIGAVIVFLIAEVSYLSGRMQPRCLVHRRVSASAFGGGEQSTHSGSGRFLKAVTQT